MLLPWYSSLRNVFYTFHHDSSIEDLQYKLEEKSNIDINGFRVHRGLVNNMNYALPHEQVRPGCRRSWGHASDGRAAEYDDGVANRPLGKGGTA